MSIVSNVGKLCTSLDYYKNLEDHFSQPYFDAIYPELCALTLNAFGPFDKPWQSIQSINTILKEHGVPFCIDYEIDRSEVHLSHEHQKSGFVVTNVTYILADGNVKKLAQVNLATMLNAWANEHTIFGELMKQFQHEFTVMYDIAYEQFMLHTSKQDYDIPDINMLLYHRRIGYQIRRVDENPWKLVKVNW